MRLIAVLDDETDPRDFDQCIWTLLNNIDPERDVQVVGGAVVAQGAALPGNGVGDACFVMDGTPKLPEEGFHRGWPEKLVMSEDVKRRVDELWPRTRPQPVQR